MINERRVLQGLVLLGGLVPVGAGLGGVLLGAGLTYDMLSVTGDSHYRYLSGLLLATGLGFWSTVPAIELKSRRFRLLTAIVFVGGLARLAGLAAMGVPSTAMLAGLAMELLVTPGFCLWQARIARLARSASESP
ncbi:MAG: DUF4345 domain-containing protein [Parvibaculaceae bacterium]